MVDRQPGDGGFEDVPRSSPPKPACELLTIQQLYELPTPRAVVAGLMRVGEFVVVYGVPACLKSFVVLDLILKIAAGLQWWGRKTIQGAVLYLAGEGAGGLKKRIKAWAIKYKVDPCALDVRVLPRAIALMQPEEFKPLVAAIAALDVKPTVIVVDTLARYMIGGDENSAQDMGLFIARCNELHAATGATIVVIHHKKKNQPTERGSSALRGAADVMIEVKREGYRVELVGDKSKDDAPLPSIHLEANQVWVDIDEDGASITSLALEEIDPPLTQEPQAAQQEPTKDEAKPDAGVAIRRALAVIFAGAEASGPQLLDASGLPKSTFYDALRNEIEGDRIAATQPKNRRTCYRLTPKAPEFVSPSPSPSPNASPDSDSDVDPSRVRQSESETPVGGSDRTTDSDSTNVRSKPHQRKKKRAKRRGPRAGGAA
ncbi:MAG: helicase RepA family protein [Planctomycetes bacterium]|nr:helicase RepA family protein [Planctomycetota bacterium]